MTTADKALQKILSGLQDKNVTYAELAAVLKQQGWSLDRVTGSHHIFRAPDGRMLSLPKHGKDMKPVYVKEARKLLKGKP
jgi:predicted RNA binding protein YcfA (HicA-like mRNA interferase family)